MEISTWNTLAERMQAVRNEVANIRLEEMELTHADELRTDEKLMGNLLQYGEHEEAQLMRLRIQDEMVDDSTPYRDQVLFLKHDLLGIESGEPDEYEWSATGFDEAA